MDIANRIKELLQKHLDGSASEADNIELDRWKQQSAANFQLYSEWMDPETRETKIKSFLLIDSKAEAEGIQWETNLSKEVKEQFLVPVRTISFRKISYAAAAIVFVLVFSYKYFYRHSSKKDIGVQVMANNDIPAPTGSRTILTLSNGSRIVVDSIQNGMVSRQGSATVIKADNGNLVYSSSQNNQPGELIYNTLSTARGGQTKLVLADGTKVWLNAASSIIYPTAFTGKDREVTITGEAYFEVAKNKALPFRVKANDMAVTVLGTHFNIMAYPEEPSKKITLLEGSVRISKDGETALLSPGQQAQVVGVGDNSSNGKDHGAIGREKQIKITDADLDEAVSWKNGITSFKDIDIQAIMRKISRWYDVDVSYQGSMPERTFVGGISRNSNLSELLKILELNDIHFQLEGKKLIVKP